MSPIYCSFCQHANPSGAKFCSACGGALEIVEAELAALAQRHVAQATDPASTVRRAAFAAGPSPRTDAKRPIPLPATRSMLAAALLMAASMPAFRADQQPERRHAPANVSIAGAALVADAGIVPFAPGNRLTDVRMREGPIYRAAVGSSWVLGAEGPSRVADSAAEVGSPAPKLQARGDHARAEVPSRGLNSVPASRSAAAKPQATVTTPPSRAPFAMGETASPVAEAATYPIASSNCTDGVAALGLCRTEATDNDP